MRIISDLDGTLLNNEGKISDFTIEILEKFDVNIIIATGRSYENIPFFLKNMDEIVITMNGASIIKKQKEIYSKNLLESEIQEIMKTNLAKNAEVVVLENNFNFSYLRSSNINLPFFNIENKVQKIYDPKSLIMIIDSRIGKKFDYINKWGNFNISSWPAKDGYTAFEFQNIGSGKGNAISWLKEKKIIDEFIYFGDSSNDFSVLKKYPECFYKMKNSLISSSKILSKEAVASNNQDGVAKTIMNIYKGGKTWKL